MEGPVGTTVHRSTFTGSTADVSSTFGQSVFLLEPDLGDRLIAKLRELGVRRWARTVYVPM